MSLIKEEKQVLKDIEKEFKIKIYQVNSPQTSDKAQYVQKGGHVDFLKIRPYYGKMKVETGSLPESIGALSKLTWLRIEKFGLESIPDSIGNLKELEVFHYFGPQNIQAQPIIGNLPDSIGNWANLVEFYVFSMNLKKVPNTIGNFKKMLLFRMGETLIEILPQSIENWTNLRKFEIFNMKIRKLPDTIGNYEKLKEFYIEDTLIDDIPISTKNWVNLQEALIEKSQLTKIPDSLLYWLNLKKIRFYGNPFNETDEKIVDGARLLSMGNYKVINGNGLAFLRKKMYERLQSLQPGSIEGFVPPESWKNLKNPLINEDYFNNYFNRLLDYSEHLLLAVGSLLIKYKFYEKAKQIYERLRKMSPNLKNATDGLERIERLQMNLSLDEQVKICEKEVAESNDFHRPEYLSTLAKLKYKLGEYSETIDIYTKSLEKNPRYTFKWYILGKAYLKQGNNEEAKKAFEMVKEHILSFKAPGFSLKKIEDLILKVN